MRLCAYSTTRIVNTSPDIENSTAASVAVHRRLGITITFMTEQQAPKDQPLSKSRKTLVRLDKMCCNPDRSPAMTQLSSTLEEAAQLIDAATAEPSQVEPALAALENAGAQVGRLQVGCCAPARMPLYANLLEDLTQAQLAVNRAAGSSHE